MNLKILCMLCFFLIMWDVHILGVGTYLGPYVLTRNCRTSHGPLNELKGQSLLRITFCLGGTCKCLILLNMLIVMLLSLEVQFWRFSDDYNFYPYLFIVLGPCSFLSSFSYILFLCRVILSLHLHDKCPSAISFLVELSILFLFDMLVASPRNTLLFFLFCFVLLHLWPV